jgi:hypothetical protein
VRKTWHIRISEERCSTSIWLRLIVTFSIVSFERFLGQLFELIEENLPQDPYIS